MSSMTDDIFKKTRAGFEYLEYKIKEYEKDIERLTLDIRILTEELERERKEKMDER